MLRRKKPVWTWRAGDVSMAKGNHNVSNSRESVMDEAIAWHLGLEEADAAQWHDFIAWLEADPAHAEAYDRLTLEDAEWEAPAAAPSPRMMTQPLHVRRGWLRWGGAAGGLAAAAAAAWFAIMPAAVTADPYALETAPGVHRSVSLSDGTHIRMNGGTRLVLDHKDPRIATLEHGEAMFEVVHHSDRPFEVHAGSVTLRDVGTVFNVARSESRLRVGVAEGEVLYQPDQEKLSLRKGMQLALREGAGQATVTQVDASSVGGWTNGHLDFRDVALSSVAEDVSRSTGVKVAVAPTMADRRFTGTLRLDRSPGEVARSLAALADAVAVQDGPRWVISPKSGGAR